MNYPEITPLLNAVRERIASSGAVPDARVSVITSYGNLFELIPELSVFPAAVVCCGDVVPENCGASRTVEVGIILVDEFRPGETLAEGCGLIDAMCALLTGERPGQMPALGGARLELLSIRALEVDSMHTAWIVNLSAKMSCLNF